MSTISPLPYTRNASRDAMMFDSGRLLALESDNSGLIDTDSLTQRGELHHLFEGAVVVSEWDDDEPDFDDIEFDD
jgi:hypothetical protein